MNTRPMLFYIIFLLGNGMVWSLATAEDSNEKQTVAAEVTGKALIIELENESEALPEEGDNKVVIKQKSRSIKMIVGGQSTDGIAKQGTLPVDD